jgi:hypothetical protein
MQPSRFDRLTVSLSTRLSRRRALATGAAGLSALSAATRLLPASAQDATPATAESADASPGFIYVQLADRGTWTPKPDEEGIFELALYGAGEQTLYFATGGDRIVGTMPTDQFLDELGFTPANPPNAAVEVWTEDGQRDVLVVQLIDPVYSRTYGDDAEEILRYDARVLSAYTGERLAEWLPDVDDDQLPLQFTRISLFIDSGCFTVQSCYKLAWGRSQGTYVGALPGGNVRRLPNVLGECIPWRGITMAELNALCNEGYPECEGSCIAD